MTKLPLFSRLQVTRATLTSVLFSLALPSVSLGQIYPHAETTTQLASPQSQSTGIVVSKIGANYYRGSGTVARNEKLIYSAGHMIASNGVWASELYFLRAWNSSSIPALSQMKQVRGYKKYTEYQGPSDNLAFSRDFIVGYDTTNSFGTPLQTFVDGASQLTSSSTTKLIAGYPAVIDYTGAAGAAYQYYTGTFTSAMYSVYPTYLNINGVSTGGGNSGGPVFVSDNGTFKIAGVLISGATNAAGVYALTSTAETMAQSAMSAIGVTGSAAATPPSTPSTPPAPTAPASVTLACTPNYAIPDGNSNYSVLSMSVANLSGTIKTVTLSLTITAKVAGELDVFLRSPNGRVSLIRQNNTTDKSSNVVSRTPT
jgi:Proprotein convertase P-domain